MIECYIDKGDSERWLVRNGNFRQAFVAFPRGGRVNPKRVNRELHRKYAEKYSYLDFLSECAGEPIADELLVLLAEDHKVAFYRAVRGGGHASEPSFIFWVCGPSSRIFISTVGFDVFRNESPLVLPDTLREHVTSRTKIVPCSLSDVLSSNSVTGRENCREAIVDFILSHATTQPDENVVDDPDSVKRDYVIYPSNGEFCLYHGTHREAVERAEQLSKKSIGVNIRVAPVSDVVITRSVTETVRL